MKTKRQAKLLEIITNQEIETQEQLQKALANEGFSTTQATISRDMKELRVYKELSANGKHRYASSMQETASTFSGRLHKIFRECVTSVDSVQNLVVIKTLPGLAHGAGSAIDGMELPYLLGTLAGDDTTLLIMRDTASASSLYAEIKKMLD